MSRKVERPTRSSPPKRGRPAKFGRPSRLVALTLPEDVIDSLRRVNPDIGWAIVQLVDAQRSLPDNDSKDERSRPGVELAEVGRKRSLIVVGEASLRGLQGVTTIPMGDGRAFLAFDGPKGVAELELALLDRIDELSESSSERATLAQIRDTLRSWRRDASLRFLTRSIIVVEQAKTGVAR